MIDRIFAKDVFGFEVPDDDEGLSYPLHRVKGGGKLRCTILSDEMLACPTHYVSNKTLQCMGEDCPRCKHNVEKRWHGWVAGHQWDTGKTKIVELTHRAAISVQRWRKEFGILRGATLELVRPAKKHNGRLFASLTPRSLPLESLPACPNVRACLYRLWGLEENDRDPFGINDALYSPHSNGVAER